MKEENNFKNEVLEEVGLLIDLPVSSKKVQVFSKDDYEENKKMRCYTLTNQLILIVPPSLIAYVIEATKKINFNKEKPLKALKLALNLNNHRVENETDFLFLNPQKHYLAPLNEGYKILQIDDEMLDFFNSFKNACSQEDLEEGLVSIDDALVFGCFHGKRLIGVASYWFLTNRLADIGVIIHPDYRRHGIGKALVSKLSQWGINHGKINMYRHDIENEKSRKLAFSLGFEKYVNLILMKEKNDRN